MSYTAPDFVDDAQQHLARAGYEIHFGGPLDADGQPSPLAEGDGIEQASIFWFSWTQEGCDIEVGEFNTSEMCAWADAMKHWFDNATIAKD